MKIIFAGTPEFAVPTLQVLLDSPHEVVAVYSQPDRPAGRGRQLRASPVKQLAEMHAIPVMQPVTLKDEAAINELAKLQADLMVVVAYGLILPPAVLQALKYGCLNVHASLLPAWRGAAPIQRAILAGDKCSGITIMQMDEGLDTGAMLKQLEVPITIDMTGEQLHDKLAVVGADSLLEVVNAIDQGDYPPAEQQENAQASYASKLSKAEAEIDWTLSAQQIIQAIKAFNAWPVAFTFFSGKKLRIWDAHIVQTTVDGKAGEFISLAANKPVIACGVGAIVLLEVQPEGKKRMPADAYMNARKADIKAGVIFG